MRAVGFRLLLVALLLAPAIAGATEIEPGIFVLDGIDESLPHDDLEPLAQVIRKAEIVGLGEAVHTTAGYSQVKFRIFKYMVEELGFRVFGFESPWIAAERTAEYVQSCEGSARNAITGLFGVWQNASVRDLIAWMCEWNQRHPGDRVHFYGYDIQQQGDLFRIRPFLDSFGVDDVLQRDLGTCLNNRVTATIHNTCIAALDEIESFLRGNEADIVASTSEEDLAWAWIHLVGIRSYENQRWFSERDLAESTKARDSGMAFVAEAIREIRFPDKKTAIWAHNFHIAKGRVIGRETMGLFLKKAFKRKYRTIGIVSREASLDWLGVHCGPWATATPGSVEDLLSQFGEAALLVDLSFPGGKPPFLRKGRVYDINFAWRLIPKHRFNGLIYLDSAEKMRPLAWPACSS